MNLSLGQEIERERDKDSRKDRVVCERDECPKATHIHSHTYRRVYILIYSV